MGHKSRGPSGPSVQEQFNTAQSGYQSRARDFAAEGGGQVDVESAAPQPTGNKQAALDDYKNRMEAKFKTAQPGNLRDNAAKAGAGVGSTNVSPGTRQKQVIGEEDNKKASLFS